MKENMITLDEFLVATRYMIETGSKFEWACFGSNARWFDATIDHYEVSVIFDTETTQVYLVTFNDPKRKVVYRWMNSEMAELYVEESNFRKLNPYNFTGHDPVTDIEDFDIMEKITAVFSGKMYDTKVAIKLNVSDDELFALMKEAHRMDITLNQLVENALLAKPVHEDNDEPPEIQDEGEGFQ